jgi:hypothetical protein
MLEWGRVRGRAFITLLTRILALWSNRMLVCVLGVS